tara:strand:- start:1657 stop:3231 length:1575 start_codon:yes stop_codon:yes gene_type:complete
MANDNIAGLGRFNKKSSTASDAYSKLIQQAGKDIGQLGTGYMAAQAEIGKRKGEAAAMVKDADFSDDTAIQDMFGADAEELRGKIDGSGEGAYDFANPADIARFKADIGSFNAEVKEFEPIYTKAVSNLQDLESSYHAWSKTGFDPEQAETKNVNGIDMYNAKAGYDGYNSALMASDAMRYSKLKKTADGYIAIDSVGAPQTDIDGNVITYKSKQEYLKNFVELGKPVYEPVPIIQGADLVREKGWGRVYDTKPKATSAFNEYVTKHSLKAKRAYAEDRDVSIDSISDMRDEATGLTIYEEAYRDAMVQQWVDEQQIKEPSDDEKRSATGRRDAQLRILNAGTVVGTAEAVDVAQGDDFIGPAGVESVAAEEVILPLGGLGSLDLTGRFEIPLTDDELLALPEEEREGAVREESSATIYPSSLIVSPDGSITIQGRTIGRVTGTGSGTGELGEGKAYTYRPGTYDFEQNRAQLSSLLERVTGKDLDYYLSNEAKGQYRKADFRGDTPVTSRPSTSGIDMAKYNN